MPDEDKANGNATDKGEEQAPGQGKDQEPQGSIPKARFDEVNSKRKAAEAALAEMVEMLKTDVPEDMRDLIPAGLPPVEQAKWIKAAMAKGIFNKAPVNGPDSRRPGGKPPANFDNLSPAQMRAAGYKS
ncbi:MAG: hypothetical protein LDL11_06620 [Desulfarculus sp.]|nr:hypothetical protein [Desulfarculus sp.]